MSEEREEIKKTLVNETEKVSEVRASEETRIYNARKQAADADGKTRIYASSDEERRMTGTVHRWIGEDDGRGTRVAGRLSDDRPTRIVGADPSVRETQAADKKTSAAVSIKRGIEDLRKVKVADRKKFSRFLKIVAVFALIFILEIGYFCFASHVKKMPEEIKETQKELKLTQKENGILEKEIEDLGDYDSVEELKASWERLEDKVDKAAAGTFY